MNKSFEKEPFDIEYPYHVYESMKKEKAKGDMKFFLLCFIPVLIFLSTIVISDYKKYSYMDSYGHVYIEDYIENKIYLDSPDYILFIQSSDEWSFVQEDKDYHSGTKTIDYVPFNKFETCVNMLLSKGVKQYGLSCLNKNTGEQFSLIKDIHKINLFKENQYYKSEKRNVNYG